MNGDGTAVDIDDCPDLVRLVEDVVRTDAPYLLRKDGKVVAVIRPAASAEDYGPGRVKTAADFAAFRAAFGGWRGIVDVDQFKRDNAASKRIPSRPPVDL